MYFYETTDYFKTLKHFVVSFDINDVVIPSESFFNNFKSYFLRNHLTRYDQYWKIMDMIHGITPLTNAEYKKRIKEISYEQIIHIIKKGIE